MDLTVPMNTNNTLERGMGLIIAKVLFVEIIKINQEYYNRRFRNDDVFRFI